MIGKLLAVACFLVGCMFAAVAVGIALAGHPAEALWMAVLTLGSWAVAVRIDQSR